MQLPARSIASSFIWGVDQGSAQRGSSRFALRFQMGDDSRNETYACYSVAPKV